MSEVIFAIEFAKHIDLPRVVDYLFSLGHPLNKLHEKDDCYRFEYQTIKELKAKGYNQFFKKELTPEINYIIAKRRNRNPVVVAVS